MLVPWFLKVSINITLKVHLFFGVFLLFVIIHFQQMEGQYDRRDSKVRRQ